MRFVASLALASIGLIACSGSASPGDTVPVAGSGPEHAQGATATPAPTGPANLSFRVTLQDGAEERGVAAGDTLKSGTESRCQSL